MSMSLDKPLIDGAIKKRTMNNDPPRQIAVRNKASPYWGLPTPYNRQLYEKIFKMPIDGIKVYFRYTVLKINARPNLKPCGV